MPSSSTSSRAPSATYVVAIYDPDSPSTVLGYVSTSQDDNQVDTAEVTTDISGAAQFTVELYSPTDTLYNLLGTSTSGAFSGMALGSQSGYGGDTSTGSASFSFYTFFEATTPKAQGPPSGSGTEEYFDGTGTESAIWEVDLTLLTLTPHWINPADGSDSGPLYGFVDSDDNWIGSQTVDNSPEPNVLLGLIAVG